MPSLVSSSPTISLADAPLGEDQHAVADLRRAARPRNWRRSPTCLLPPPCAGPQISAGGCRHRRLASARRAAAARATRFIQRAISTFCALPPDSADSFRPGSLGRTSKAAPSCPRLADHLAVAHAAALEEAADVGQEHVVDDLQAVDAAGALPVGGQQRETEVDRRTRVQVGLRHRPPLRRWRCWPERAGARAE